MEEQLAESMNENIENDQLDDEVTDRYFWGFSNLPLDVRNKALSVTSKSIQSSESFNKGYAAGLDWVRNAALVDILYIGDIACNEDLTKSIMRDILKISPEYEYAEISKGLETAIKDVFESLNDSVGNLSINKNLEQKVLKCTVEVYRDSHIKKFNGMLDLICTLN